MKCSVCGFENNSDLNFCENCGAVLSKTYEKNTESFEPNTTSPDITVLWNKIMAKLSAEEIKLLYNTIVEYCEDYSLLCYKELKVREYNENADIGDEEHIAKLYPEWVEMIKELDDKELDERICNAYEWDEAFIILCMREQRTRSNK